MALPAFNIHGDLPQGLHETTLIEILERFGAGSEARQQASAVLQRVHHLAKATGKLERLILFGSYITSKQEPNDVDIILVMADDFSLDACDEATRVLFDHQRAHTEFGASVFWICPAVLLRGSLDEFLLGWGTKRDMTIRGIVEVTL